MKNKVDVIRHSMLCSVREEAGLGSPPDPFFTNASECVNSMLKNKVQYKRSELPRFIEKLKELCDEQDREVERAVISRGKYRFRSQYCNMEVPETKWFQMSREQRVKHLKKVSNLSVSDVRDTSEVTFCSDVSGPSTSQAEEVTVHLLLEKLKPISSHLTLPLDTIQGIARKAHEILQSDCGIVPAPGCEASLMVMSKTGKRPHLIVPKKKNGGLACDSDCPQYK